MMIVSCVSVQTVWHGNELFKQNTDQVALLSSLLLATADLFMPKLPDEPLHKTNINLYSTDVEDMKKLYGYGWSEVVRNLVRKHVRVAIWHKEMEDERE